MGYRLNLTKISNKDYSAFQKINNNENLKQIIKQKTINDDEDRFFPVYEIFKSIYCLGENLDFLTELREKYSQNFFNQEYNKIFSEYYDEDLFILKKEGLNFIINEYFNIIKKQKTKNFYYSKILALLNSKEYEEINDLIKEVLKNNEFDKIKLFVKEFTPTDENIEKLTYYLSSYLYSLFNYDYDEMLYLKNDIYLKDNYILTNSIIYERDIYNLIYIYKTFNEKKEKLVIYGY